MSLLLCQPQLIYARNNTTNAKQLGIYDAIFWSFKPSVVSFWSDMLNQINNDAQHLCTWLYNQMLPKEDLKKWKLFATQPPMSYNHNSLSCNDVITRYVAMMS